MKKHPSMRTALLPPADRHVCAISGEKPGRPGEPLDSMSTTYLSGFICPAKVKKKERSYNAYPMDDTASTVLLPCFFFNLLYSLQHSISIS